jgi:UDP-glucose 4-epimerase
MMGQRLTLKGRNVLVTGGAGFIGSHIVDRLAAQGNHVTVYDNLSTGTLRFLERSRQRIRFVEADMLDEKTLAKTVRGHDFVFHMAAYADIRGNLKDPARCLKQNTIATSNLLEAMRKHDVEDLAFPSTGSVYGEPTVFPTPEDAPFPTQTSMYAASKLACEGLIEAYSAGYGFDARIFRFVSLMGERYTHGCVFDFIKKLRKNPKRLEILGDGRQRKSYLHVKDCIDAMFLAIETSGSPVLNLGHDDYMEVTPIARIVCEESGLRDVNFAYTGGKRGWVGDSPYIHLDISRMKKLGWSPTRTIEESVRETARWLIGNPWALRRR